MESAEFFVSFCFKKRELGVSLNGIRTSFWHFVRYSWSFKRKASVKSQEYGMPVRRFVLVLSRLQL